MGKRLRVKNAGDMVTACAARTRAVESGEAPDVRVHVQGRCRAPGHLGFSARTRGFDPGADLVLPRNVERISGKTARIVAMRLCYATEQHS